MRLADLKMGQRARILGFDKGIKLERKLFEIGIMPGSIVEMLSRYPFKGPLLLQVGSTKIALGRGIANSVTVEVTN